MSVRKAFLGFVHLLLLLFFLMAGVFFLLLPYLPKTRLSLIDFFTNSYHSCTEIGLGLVFLTAFLFFSFFSLHRGRQLSLRMGVSADLKVIQQATEECFFEEFTKKVSLKDLAVGPKSKLEFTIRLSQVEEKDREELLLRVEKHLTNLLQKRFGYSKDFYTIVDSLV